MKLLSDMSAGMRFTILIFCPVVGKIMITEPLVMIKSDMECMVVCAVKFNLSLMLLNISICKNPFTTGRTVKMSPWLAPFCVMLTVSKVLITKLRRVSVERWYSVRLLMYTISRIK